MSNRVRCELPPENLEPMFDSSRLRAFNPVDPIKVPKGIVLRSVLPHATEADVKRIDQEIQDWLDSQER